MVVKCQNSLHILICMYMLNTNCFVFLHIASSGVSCIDGKRLKVEIKGPIYTVRLCRMRCDKLMTGVRYIEDITREREDMNFMFEWQEQYLTSERSERVRYCFCHENIKFISSSQRVMFFLLYGD